MAFDRCCRDRQNALNRGIVFLPVECSLRLDGEDAKKQYIAHCPENTPHPMVGLAVLAAVAIADILAPTGSRTSIEGVR